MIKTIRISEKDINSLERILVKDVITQSKQPTDYKDMVVIKPWGYEYLAFENEHIAMWFLHIKSGHSTSMHCHPNKKTCLILMSGKALCNTFNRRNNLENISGVAIEKSVFHSTKALSDDGINLIEIETPPNKTDLVRLFDEYGRQTEGYEGFSEMRTENLEKYNYCHYHEDNNLGITNYKISEQELVYENYSDNEHFKSEFHADVNGIYSMGRGEILSSSNKSVLKVGGMVSGSDLLKMQSDGLLINDKSLLIKITNNNIS